MNQSVSDPDLIFFTPDLMPKEQEEIAKLSDATSKFYI